MTRFSNALQMVRFNAPLYGVILLAVAGGLGAQVLPGPWPWVGAAVALGACWYGAASFLAFHMMFDTSGLLEGVWLRDLVPGPVQRWAQISVALEQTTLPLEEVFLDASGVLLDVFSDQMTEPAVQRARRLVETATATPAARDALPLDDDACDLTVVTLAAHELRDPTQREALFAELRRVTAPTGTVVVVEHLRDLWALFAFGPGFLHFYPRSLWLDLGERAGLRDLREHTMTPFVRVFLWRPGP